MGNLLFIEETHEYIVDGVVYPSVTQVISSAGLNNYNNVDKYVLERSANFGTAVHKAIELHSKNVLDKTTLDESLLPYISAWDTFCKDFSFKSEMQEYRSFSSSLKVGFTIDHIGNDSILDIKTGTPKPADIIQVSTYNYLYPCKNAYILYLDKDKYKAVLLKRQEKSKGVNVFMSCLTIYNFKNENNLL